MYEELKARLTAAVDAVVCSESVKKLVVAGPGSGKTHLFRLLLEKSEAGQDNALVLTFINNLKDDLARDLGTMSQVYTFHAYCRRLLHQSPRVRGRLTDAFHYFPPLPTLIKTDWEIMYGGKIPKFVGLMRDLQEGDETDFYTARADYYDAVSFDDSVFRAYKGLKKYPGEMDHYKLLLVDEYQDFNKLEVELLDMMSATSSIVVAGDDDQALYSQLRNSDTAYIRGLYAEAAYTNFSLPFCMRCTAPVVGAVGDLIHRARALGRLPGRIDKPYEFYPPKKERDTNQYPNLKDVVTTVQNGRANYFGRYIEQELAKIPEEEIREAEEGHFPTVLVIGPQQYLRQIREHLESVGYPCMASNSDESIELRREDGLRILKASEDANLGWRILLELDKPAFFLDAVQRSAEEDHSMVSVLDQDYQAKILAEVRAFTEDDDVDNEAPVEEKAPRINIKLVSYEGSKGLSAQHVFIVGLHNGDLPRVATAPTDLEICKFLVALTRTRKQCHLLHTRRWGATTKEASVFLSWIDRSRISQIFVNAKYWKQI